MREGCVCVCACVYVYVRLRLGHSGPRTRIQSCIHVTPRGPDRGCGLPGPPHGPHLPRRTGQDAPSPSHRRGKEDRDGGLRVRWLVGRDYDTDRCVDHSGTHQGGEGSRHPGSGRRVTSGRPATPGRPDRSLVPSTESDVPRSGSRIPPVTVIQ